MKILEIFFSLIREKIFYLQNNFTIACFFNFCLFYDCLSPLNSSKLRGDILFFNQLIGYFIIRKGYLFLKILADIGL